MISLDPLIKKLHGFFIYRVLISKWWLLRFNGRILFPWRKLFFNVIHILNLTPLLSNRWIRDVLMIIYRDNFIVGSTIFCDVCCGSNRPPFVLVLSFEYLILSSILVLNYFIFSFLQFINVFHDEIWPFCYFLHWSWHFAWMRFSVCSLESNSRIRFL